MNGDEWDEAYAAWRDDCLVEFNAEYGDLLGHRLYHEEPDEGYPEDYEPGHLVEFAEDGDAYPHGMGGTAHIRRAVTPWKDSPHYMDWRAG